MLTIGYIGSGKSVHRYHLPFVVQNPNLHVKAIYSPHIENCKWERVPGVNYTNDVSEVLDDPEIQLVCICCAAMHYEYARLALEKGKNILVEKPFVDTLEQAKEIFALGKEKGLMVECYQNRRYDSDFLTVQKVIESGKLGDLQEIEMSFDYYRPYIPESITSGTYTNSYLYGHGCHTIDQVISYFGNPDHVVYDVRCLLGKGRFNDYFDLDLFYGNLKISVKSSYFRIKSRPSFIVYGRKGMFVKQTKDRQEEHLKLFYMPGNEDFGIDLPEHYGVLTYEENGVYHEEKVVSEKGDYGRVYQAIYDHLINHKEQVVKPEQTLKVMEILETGAKLAYK